ncbi:hypothetical protein GCM10010932_07200 [Agromyces flavus]|nr:hypothetical protein GCM10010932_07200 [Agromyces flavus]
MRGTAMPADAAVTSGSTGSSGTSNMSETAWVGTSSSHDKSYRDAGCAPGRESGSAVGVLVSGGGAGSVDGAGAAGLAHPLVMSAASARIPAASTGCGRRIVARARRPAFGVSMAGG